MTKLLLAVVLFSFDLWLLADTIGLSDFEARGLEEDPMQSVQASQNKLLAGRETTAQSRYLPEISFATGTRQTLGAPKEYETNRYYMITIRKDLLQIPQEALATDRVRNEQNLQKLSEQLYAQDRILLLRKAYFDLQYAQEAEAFNKEQLKIAQQVMELNQVRAVKGLSSELELARAKASFLKQKTAFEESGKNLEVALDHVHFMIPSLKGRNLMHLVPLVIKPEALASLPRFSRPKQKEEVYRAQSQDILLQKRSLDERWLPSIDLSVERGTLEKTVLVAGASWRLPVSRFYERQDLENQLQVLSEQDRLTKYNEEHGYQSALKAAQILWKKYQDQAAVVSTNEIIIKQSFRDYNNGRLSLLVYVQDFQAGLFEKTMLLQLKHDLLSQLATISQLQANPQLFHSWLK